MASSGNAALGTAQESRQHQEFPDYDDIGLAARLRLSVSTLRAWRCRYPERLPPGVRVGRIWLYDKKVVEEWLASKRESAPRTEIKAPIGAPCSGVRRRGKPSKDETAAAKALGLTVPAWRARITGMAGTNVPPPASDSTEYECDSQAATSNRGGCNGGA